MTILYLNFLISKMVATIWVFERSSVGTQTDTITQRHSQIYTVFIVDKTVGGMNAGIQKLSPSSKLLSGPLSLPLFILQNQFSQFPFLPLFQILGIQLSLWSFSNILSSLKLPLSCALSPLKATSRWQN